MLNLTSKLAASFPSSVNKLTIVLVSKVVRAKTFVPLMNSPYVQAMTEDGEDILDGLY